MAATGGEQDKSVISVSPEAGLELCREGEIVGAVGFPSDAVTVAQLRARVEQQSSLIAMLKQRNDDTFKEVDLILCMYVTWMFRVL